MQIAVDSIRHISKNLSTPVLRHYGLTESIKTLVNNMRQSSGIEVLIDIDDVDHLISEEKSIQIYRVVQECFNNILKHADTGTCIINIKRQTNCVFILICDHGKGFEMDGHLSASNQNEGLGLLTMDRRINSIGGTFNIWSKNGMGTLVTFSIPATPVKDHESLESNYS